MDNGQWTMDNGQWTMDKNMWVMKIPKIEVKRKQRIKLKQVKPIT